MSVNSTAGHIGAPAGVPGFSDTCPSRSDDLLGVMTINPRDWYVPLAGDAPARVFAFPHAGAGTARLVRLAKAVSPHATLWGANLPGRQARLGEPPITDLDELVGKLADQLTGLTRPPYALFGYCGGALLALLVARALRDRGAPAPAALIVASYEAPDIAYRPRLAHLPSRLLWADLIRQGAIGDDTAGDDRLRTVAEPVVRADFSILSDFRYAAAPPLECPVIVCHGADDPMPRGAWLGWRRQSVHPPRLRSLTGGHWLLDRATDEVAAVIVETMAGVTP